MTLPSLTPILKKTLDFMADFERERGFPPTYEEIGVGLGKTKVTAWEAVQSLTKKGYIVMGERNTSRNRRVCAEYMAERAKVAPLQSKAAAAIRLADLMNSLAFEITGHGTTPSRIMDAMDAYREAVKA